MTTMTRFVPFRSAVNDVAILQNRLNSIFSDFAAPALGSASGLNSGSESLAAGNFIPAVDVYEDAQKLSLKLEVPGIRQEDLDIKLENQTLTVRGERRFAAEEKEENFHRIERRFGSFVRSFSLPLTVDTNAVTATYENGVLAIQMAKQEAARPRQVKVEIGPGHTTQPTPEQRTVEAATSR